MARRTRRLEPVSSTIEMYIYVNSHISWVYMPWLSRNFGYSAERKNLTEKGKDLYLCQLFRSLS